MNNKLNNIILVTFDVHRVDYPTMSYSVASILATLKHYNIKASHYSFDMKRFKKTIDGYTTTDGIIDMFDVLDYLKKFSCIALGVTRWSESFAYTLIKSLKDYKGIIVVGGYEITAMKEDSLIINLLNIQHFIRGYAEKALVKLMSGEYPNNQKFIEEELDIDYLFSPYAGGILNTYGRKIYWETKRGCSYNCGFCEWGKAQTRMLTLNIEKVFRDIESFSQSNIDEINILDATFNIKNDYQSILQKLMERTNAKITFQARFEALKPDFLKFCTMQKDRLHLEFGLQTIHKDEMEVIGRHNNIDKIITMLTNLNDLEIDYEVSIIYAIPRQTVTTLIDTIEFLRVNKCKKIMAFPLQIPENSELKEKIREYQITFKDDDFHIKSVASSISFTKEAREDMDEIAFFLNQDLKPSGLRTEYLSKLEHTQFQYEFNREYFQSNRKLTEPIVLKIRGLEWNIDDAVGVDEILNNGIPQSVLRVSREYSGGNNKGEQPEKFYYKIIFGQSGYLYVYRVFVN